MKKEIFKHFEYMDVPNAISRIFHPLQHNVFISIVGILHGHTGLDFTKYKHDFFTKYLDPNNGLLRRQLSHSFYKTEGKVTPYSLCLFRMADFGAVAVEFISLLVEATN